MRSRRSVILGLGGAAGALAFTLGLGWWRTSSRQTQDVVPLPLPLSEMSFTLTTHRGENLSPADWIGKPTMVFFGFTWCPDVCPTTLSDISNWLEALGTEADRLNVALITVDPERDSPEILAEYLSYFDPRILGLTGPLSEIERAAAGFRVWFEKQPRDDGYTMNHTAGVFLFRADGSFANIIDFHEDRSFALPKIRRAMR
ncbi:SCO family protein [Abyssibius alkaniclasticus]|uniref:SCO family protein n=1 Tax=Abyssibius alkaniclasticus TaxID=2881234 RepID=UPI00236442A0|nr:SCO family protein [Abyssibius alkaniclasticus]UPH70415.1 SCO family protein [Abyssibius alkaniclasticus]|tara:strand:+ start:1239 stop:1841 length:603 start_codon:yes stop_codon:yes gene_type:complete